MMIFSLIYGVIDGAFVSNGVGSDAFAAVNLIMPVLMILGSIGYMIGTGGSALVSKTIGEGDTKKANEYFSMLVYLLIIVGIILTLIGTPLIRQIARLLGAALSTGISQIFGGVVPLIYFMRKNKIIMVLIHI